MPEWPCRSVATRCCPLQPVRSQWRAQGEDPANTKLIVGQGKRHGMANIVLRTKTTFEVAGEENPGPACKAPAPSVKERTLRFDGREYQEPKAP
jgi:hypothetical protein